MTTPLSAHGTLLARQPAATPNVFTDIAELGDLKLPELNRKDFDASVHNRNIDSITAGILRRNPMTFPTNFIPNDASMDHLTGLIKAMVSEPPPIDGYRVRWPSPLNTAAYDWIMSGQVLAIAPAAPVDGKLALDITLRFSGLMTIGGVVIGL